jgi:CHAT domain-containing protein
MPSAPLAFEQPFQALTPCPGALWYDAQKNLRFAEGFEVPMKGPQLLALSLGLVGFTGVACENSIERPVEPRLTGSFSYAPCRTDAEAPDLVPDAVCAEQSRRKDGKAKEPDLAPLRGGEEPSGSPAALREQGIRLMLAAEDLRALDRGVGILESAAAAEPGNARLWSDLAAAYLVRAQRGDDPRYLLRGLSTAERALRVDGSLPEALFNRALALESLFLTAATRDAWRDYLGSDPGSDWAVEAQERLRARDRQQAVSDAPADILERLEKAAQTGDTAQVNAIVGSFRQMTREYAEQKVLGEWAEALAQGDPGRASRWLGIARILGETLVRVNGDRLIQDSVAMIDRISAQGNPGPLQSLIEGHRAFRDGYALYKGRKTQPAAEKLEAAREALTRAGSPFAARAVFYLACCDYFARRYGKAFEDLERLTQALAGKSYPGLLGHTLWMQGLCASVDGRLAQGVELYERALAVYRRAGEKENVAACESLLAQTLGLLGHGRRAWEHGYRALRVAPQVRDPGIRSMIFMIAADSALADGAAEAALALQREAVLQASPASPLRRAETLTWLGWMEARAGSRERALGALRQAREQLREVEDSGQRQRREADIAGVEGTLVLAAEPRRAIALLSSALAAYQKEENHVFSLRMLLARARAERLAGEETLAEEDLRAGLAEYERLGANLPAEDVRLAHLEEMDEVFDEMIALQAERDPALAFAYADRARTRVLPGSASKLWTGDRAEASRLMAAEPEPLSLDEIRRRLPLGVSLVQFSVLPDRVLIWRIRRDGSLDFFERHIRREELEERVLRLRRLSRSKSGAWEAASRELFDLLVRPWLSQAGKDERLVFIPDKVLHLVPFAALQDRSTAHFLVQDHTIAVAPSATLYINAWERQRGTAWGNLSRGLVVGDPAVDRDLFPNLLPLPGAAAEAARLAALTGAVQLVGPAADRPAFLAEADRAEWIHLAGHAVIDPRNPLLSHLVLAPAGGGDPGMLTAREIYTLHLEDTRIVVLAACDTVRHYVPGSEGVTSLARAFHAAGVPTVVASLRAVDDTSTARLFDAFHSNLRAGDDPASALRNAQLSLLRSGDEADRSPAAWGMFEVIGASAH